MTNNLKPMRFAVLATDVVVFRLQNRALEVLTIPVTTVPQFSGMYALPGGLIDPKETAEDAAVRQLKTKIDVQGVYLEQLATFSGVDRDPRGRVVSVAYLGLAKGNEHAEQGRWSAVDDVARLGYDHNDILRIALERLRARVSYTTIIRYLLPSEFTLTELQQAYEDVLGHSLDKRNFRKKLLALNVVQETGKKRTQGASRPAELYRFRGTQIQTIELL